MHSIATGKKKTTKNQHFSTRLKISKGLLHYTGVG